MHQRILSKRFLPRLLKRYSSSNIKECSDHSIRDKNENANEHLCATNESTKDFSEEMPTEQEVSHLLKEAATFEDANDKNWATSPYPKDAPINNKNETNQGINPKDTSVILFPGQGTIKVGMIKKYLQYPAAKDLFQLTNEIIDYDLLKLCLNGPQEKLNRTEYNQAATVVSSFAALEKIRAEYPKVFETCVATAGYSIGEISALILSGAITFEDGMRLVWARGRAMQQAADRTPQGMISVYCTPKAQVGAACKAAEMWAMNLGIENPVCRTAIYLHTQAKILAGNDASLKYIQDHQREYGLSNVTKLPVSGAFHTKLMEPALKSVYQTLKSIELQEPRCKVYSNYKAKPYSNLRFMKKLILKQIVSPVRWEQCLQDIYSRRAGLDFPQTYDVGSGGRMKTILKLVNAKAWKSCIII